VPRARNTRLKIVTPIEEAVTEAPATEEIAPLPEAVPEVSLDDPALYMNRELSLLEFQQRVLDEARDGRNKLLERVKFLSIVSSNLDEFFMVRVAALKQKLSAGRPDLSIDGKTVAQQLAAVRERLRELQKPIYECFQKQLKPGLARHGIEITDYADLDHRERAAVDQYYLATIFPVLTPLAFDPGRPFPHISNLSVNLAIVLKDTDARQHFARVKVPEQLPQLVAVPPAPPSRRKAAAPLRFVWIEQVIAANLETLFPGLRIEESHPFHVIRDAEIAIKEIESDDLLETVEEAVWRRRFRNARDSNPQLRRSRRHPARADTSDADVRAARLLRRPPGRRDRRTGERHRRSRLCGRCGESGVSDRCRRAWGPGARLGGGRLVADVCAIAF